MEHLLQTLKTNLEHPLALVLIQVVAVILIARILGWLCKKINQPAVIGEILGGIMLGPSLMGWCLPEFSAFLFPAQSMANLKLLSQIGLILFMFIVGMELDLSILKNKLKNAVVISHASIIIPFILGIGLAYYIYEPLAPEGVAFSSFTLFMGIAMSITAFPVLVRIVQERGLTTSHLGNIAIACAAADDVTAWCILAFIIAFVKAGSAVSTVFLIISIVAYIFLMLKVIQPLLERMYKEKEGEGINKRVIVICFITLLLSAFVSELLGIHALFGAFLAGVIMPRSNIFRFEFVEKLEDVSTILFLPLFFVLTGLRTHVGLLDNSYLWSVCGIITLLAIVGKFAGSTFAARLVGQSWKESLTIGALMNTRGLMELVVLNIGYDLGIITKEVFSMMVIMALVTTIMTGPALDLINRRFR